MTKKVCDLVYEIQKNRSSTPFTVLVDHLELYEGPLPIQIWLGDELNLDFDDDSEGDKI